jgi:hypothetical protein
MSTTNTVLVAEKEAEAAVSEFLEMRAAILGRLSLEALRCVAATFERRLEEISPGPTKNLRRKGRKDTI